MNSRHENLVPRRSVLDLDLRSQLVELKVFLYGFGNGERAIEQIALPTKDGRKGEQRGIPGDAVRDHATKVGRVLMSCKYPD